MPGPFVWWEFGLRAGSVDQINIKWSCPVLNLSFMAYPPGFTYPPPQQQAQYQQSLQNNYQSDQPQQTIDSFSQQDSFPQQNPHQQDLYQQQDPYSQLLQQQSHPQGTQQPRAQYSQESPQTQQNQQIFYTQSGHIQQHQYPQQTSLNQFNQPNGFPQVQHVQQNRSSQSPLQPSQPAQLGVQTQQAQQIGQPGQQYLQRSPFPQHNGQAQPLQSPPQYPPQQQQQQQQASVDVAGTYELFFTGRDDPRSCMLIGEDTQPVYLSFETQESNLNQTLRTMVRYQMFHQEDYLFTYVIRSIKMRRTFTPNWNGEQEHIWVMPRSVRGDSQCRISFFLGL